MFTQSFWNFVKMRYFESKLAWATLYVIIKYESGHWILVLFCRHWCHLQQVQLSASCIEAQWRISQRPSSSCWWAFTSFCSLSPCLCTSLWSKSKRRRHERKSCSGLKWKNKISKGQKHHHHQSQAKVWCVCLLPRILLSSYAFFSAAAKSKSQI